MPFGSGANAAAVQEALVQLEELSYFTLSNALLDVPEDDPRLIKVQTARKMIRNLVLSDPFTQGIPFPTRLADFVEFFEKAFPGSGPWAGEPQLVVLHANMDTYALPTALPEMRARFGPMSLAAARETVKLPGTWRGILEKLAGKFEIIWDQIATMESGLPPIGYITSPEDEVLDYSAQVTHDVDVNNLNIISRYTFDKWLGRTKRLRNRIIYYVNNRPGLRDKLAADPAEWKRYQTKLGSLRKTMAEYGFIGIGPVGLLAATALGAAFVSRFLGWW